MEHATVSVEMSPQQDWGLVGRIAYRIYLAHSAIAWLIPGITYLCI